MPRNSGRTFSIISYVVLLAAVGLIHYGLERSSIWLLPSYGLSFVSYAAFYKKANLNFKELMVLAVLIRLMLFLAPPGLSDDYFRFLWDGQIWTEGINPYQYNPTEVQEQLNFDNQSLYDHLNSQNYNSTYPPLSQYIFSIPARIGIRDTFFGMSMIRMVILLFEIGCILLLSKLIINVKSTLIYAFNPLVILELTGNLHFEGVVLFFVLLAVLFFRKQKWLHGTVSLAFGILAKLTPLMFLPVLIRKLGLAKAAMSYVLLAVTLVLFSLPLMELEVIGGWFDGLDLFFRKFEFNAGLFFLFREIGFWIRGYDTVQTIGPMMSYAAFGLIMAYSIFVVREDTKWTEAFTVILFIQLVLATTVHPWYVIPLVAFSCLTGYAFPVLWSMMAFLSYFGYSTDGYAHPMWLIFFEYTTVGLLGLYELLKRRPLIHES